MKPQGRIVNGGPAEGPFKVFLKVKKYLVIICKISIK
jgi:hypothetical protein